MKSSYASRQLEHSSCLRIKRNPPDLELIVTTLHVKHLGLNMDTAHLAILRRDQTVHPMPRSTRWA